MSKNYYSNNVKQMPTENDLIESMKAKTYPSEVNQKIAIRLYERMLKKVDT